MRWRSRRASEVGLALISLLLYISCPLLSQRISQKTSEQLQANIRSEIKALKGQFAEILKSGDREERLKVQCRVRCTAVDDAATGKTVGDELQDIQTARDAAVNRVIVGMQTSLDRYIEHTVRLTGSHLDSATVAKRLGSVLEDEAVSPPAAFVLRSPKGSSLLVFYGLYGGIWARSTITLRAYATDGTHLKLSDAINADLNEYGSLEVKQLPSPIPDEIWLFVSGHRIAANGPNIRMRVFAYDGRKFRAVWMPANDWGDYTVRVTQQGFRIDGRDYHSGKPKHQAYLLSSDGLYLQGTTTFASDKPASSNRLK